MLESLEVDVVLHCGDVGSAAVVETLSRWPAHFVRGNCDLGREEELSAACVGNAVWHDAFASLEFGRLRIALLHGDDERRKQEALSSGEHDFVCVGHTHVAQKRKFGETTLFNPGALYRTSSPSIGLIETESREAHVIRID
jgi:hypothetical protein